VIPFAEATRLIEALLDDRAPEARSSFIGVDGQSCAGKTTFAAALAAALPGAVVVHGDDMSRAGRPLWEHERFMAEVYEPLVAGREARYRRWHWTSAEPGEELLVPPGVPVIVEGVHVLDQAVQVPWDVRVWVDVDRDLRLDRARAREGGARWACWSTNWMPREDAYVAEQDPGRRADLVVDGDSVGR
jgi:uridine kinase